MRDAFKLVIPIVLLAVGGASVLGQGSGTPRRDSTDPYSVTKNITGSISEIDSDEGTFVVIDERTGKSWMFKAGEKTNYRADKALDKAEVGWSDLAKGQRVRVRFKGASEGEAMSFGGEVLEVRLKKPKTT